MLHRAFQAVTIGDVLQKVLLRILPYQIDGNATALYEKLDRIAQEFFETGYSEALGKRTTFTKMLKQIVREFDVLPLQDIPRKPRVGIVGEILVQYHPDANNNAVGTVEAEGCEAELPSLAQFFHNSLATADWKRDTLGSVTAKQANTQKLGLWILQQYEKPAREAFEKSSRFEAGATIQELRDKAQDIVSLGNQAGEGWYLVAGMMDMIENGCPNIICAQPFACLPNHVEGRGQFKALRAKISAGQCRLDRRRRGCLLGEPTQPHQAHDLHGLPLPRGRHRRDRRGKANLVSLGMPKVRAEVRLSW